MADFNKTAAQGTNPVEWQVLILGDLHLKKAGTGSGEGTGTGDNCVAKLPLLIAEMRKKTFTHCIVMGDIGHGDGYGVLEDAAVLFDAIVAAFPGVTFWPIVGNHEHNFSGSTPAEVYTRLGISVLGSDGYYYKDIGASDRFIFLNSMTGNPTSVPGPYSLGSTQRSWLTALLGMSNNKRVHIFSHVPFFGFPPDQWRLINANHDPVQSGDTNGTVDRMLDFVYMNNLVLLNPNIESFHSGHIHLPRTERDWGLVNDQWCINWGAPCGYNWVLTTGTLEWFKRKAGFGELTRLTDGTLIPKFNRLFI